VTLLGKFKVKKVLTNFHNIYDFISHVLNNLINNLFTLKSNDLMSRCLSGQTTITLEGS